MRENTRVERVIHNIGRHEEQWMNRTRVRKLRGSMRLNGDRFVMNIAHDGKEADVNIESAYQKQRDAIEGMEIAADVHPLGPSVLILRGKGCSFEDIAKHLKVSNSCCQSVYNKVVKAVAMQRVATA